MQKVPIVTKDQADAEAIRQKEIARESFIQPAARPNAAAEQSASNAPVADLQGHYKAQIEKIPSLVTLGPILKSSRAIELTENDVEYVVTCVKHILQSHIIFQVNLLVINHVSLTG